MKATKLFATTVLGLLAVGVGAHGVGAAEKTIDTTTKGRVELHDTNTDTKPLNPGEEDGGPVNPGGGGSNTDDPDLKLIYVPDFNFGRLDVDPLATVNQKAALIDDYDLEVTFPLDTETPAVPTGELPIFAQVFNSERVDNWVLTAQATEFTNDQDDTNELNAKIRGNIPTVQKNLGAGSAAVSAGNDLSGIMGNQALEIMTYATTGESPLASVNSALFVDGTGEGANFVPDLNSSGVSIDVFPGETAVGSAAEDSYTSTITWTLKGNVVEGGNG